MTKLVRQGLVAFVALIATLGVLWGFTTLDHYQSTIQPLQQALQKASGVKKVSLVGDNGNTVKVTMGKVADFETTYDKVADASSLYLNSPTIVVVSHPDAKLQSAVEELSFPIEQGLALGKFVDMRSQVMAEAAKLHVHADLYIDNHNVYLALYDGSHYLYHVFPRGGKHP